MNVEFSFKIGKNATEMVMLLEKKNARGRWATVEMIEKVEQTRVSLTVGRRARSV